MMLSILVSVLGCLLGAGMIAFIMSDGIDSAENSAEKEEE